MKPLADLAHLSGAREHVPRGTTGQGSSNCYLGLIREQTTWGRSCLFHRLAIWLWGNHFGLSESFLTYKRIILKTNIYWALSIHRQYAKHLIHFNQCYLHNKFISSIIAIFQVKKLRHSKWLPKVIKLLGSSWDLNPVSLVLESRLSTITLYTTYSGVEVKLDSLSIKLSISSYNRLTCVKLKLTKWTYLKNRKADASKRLMATKRP